MLAFCMALVRPLEVLNEAFTDYRATLDLSVKSQTCYLQAVINNEFDFYKRRIYVRNYEFDFYNLLTWNIATPSRTLVGVRGTGEEYLRNNRGQIGVNIPDFEIVLPLNFTLSNESNQILKRVVNKYKLATKKYIISYE